MGRLSNKGLTLVELMIALAVSSFVILVTFGIGAAVAQNLKFMQSRILANVDLIRLADYFALQIPNSGGPNIPPGGAIFIENQCQSRDGLPNCQNSDRLSLVFQSGPVACRVVSRLAADDFQLSSDSGICCLESQDLIGHQVLLVLGEHFSQKYVTQARPSECRIQVSAGPVRGNDFLPPAPADWIGAEVVPVDIESYFLQRSTNELFRIRFELGPDSGTGKLQGLAYDVFDFQISAGYDFAPADGVVVDTATSTDEWLYNTSSASEAFGVGAFTTATPSNLRMLAVGLIMKLNSPAQQRISQVQILDGVPHSHAGVILKASVSKVALRRTYGFE